MENMTMIQKVLQPTKSTVMAKRTRVLQKTLKECRDNSLEVEKRDGAYYVYANDDLVLRALNGQRSYLVQYNTELFEPNTNEVTA
jgi:hypothetical protein